MRLSTVQALRGVAAIMVLLYHAARHVDKAYGAPVLARTFAAGHAGIDLFFVISGFIILFVHRRDIGVPSRFPQYAARRLSRILPIYWVALALTVAMVAMHGDMPPAPLDMAWSALLLPSIRKPILDIAWTLQFEMFFYAVFAVLILSRRIGLMVLAVWLGWIAITNLGLIDARGLPGPYWDFYTLEFFAGMAGAQILQERSIPTPRMIAAVGAAVFVAMMVLETLGVASGYALPARVMYGMGAATLLVGLVAAERAGTMRVMSWLSAVGTASYSIYLFQFVSIGIAWQILRKAGLADRLPPPLVLAVLVGAGLAGGFIVARYVERPLLRAMRRVDGRKPRAIVEVPLTGA